VAPAAVESVVDVVSVPELSEELELDFELGFGDELFDELGVEALPDDEEVVPLLLLEPLLPELPLLEPLLLLAAEPLDFELLCAELFFLVGLTPSPKSGALEDFFFFVPVASWRALATGRAYSLAAGEFGSTVTPGSTSLWASATGARTANATAAAVSGERARSMRSRLAVVRASRW
jgi:hypothetical protein